MIDIALIIFFAFMAFRILRTVRQESAIFREFEQSQSFAWLALLFPLGPIVYLLTIFRSGWLVAIVLMVSCYLPSLIAAKKRISFFERAGTDRVRNAENAAAQAFGAAIGGIVYAVILLCFSFIGIDNA